MARREEPVAQSAPSLVGTWRLVSFVTGDGQAEVPYWDGSCRFLGPNRIELGVVTHADGQPATNRLVLMWERVSA
jgi:hypothetical protein